MKGTPQPSEETELMPDGNKRTHLLMSKMQPLHLMSGTRHPQEGSRHKIPETSPGGGMQLESAAPSTRQPENARDQHPGQQGPAENTHLPFL